MKNPVNFKGFFAFATKRLRCCPGLLKLLIALISLNAGVIYSQVGVHTDFPDASSAMDISASNKGLLIPRVTLSENLDDPSPVSSPAVGLLVFNSGSNQEMGFYYWDGSLWVPLAGGGGGGDGWLLTGNSGTEVGTNFIGTTDGEDLAIYTNATERMRVVSNGQVVIDSTAARYSSNLFTVFGNTTQNYAINAFSPFVGVYAVADVYGMMPRVNNSAGTPLYSKNTSPTGYGAWTIGSNQSAGYWSSRSAGLCSRGNDGIQSWGLGADGIGITAMGPGVNPAIIPGGVGGTFAGAFGIYGRSTNGLSNGTGIIGVGNNLTSSYYLAGGSGGAFTGNDGVFGKSINVNGTGVIGLGNNINSAPIIINNGSGGAFTGLNIGAGGWGAINGLIGWGTNATTGTGITGAGNNLPSPVLPGGGGGAFNGTGIGTASWAVSATGTGVLGAGNNAVITPLATGSGGAFTGNDGLYGKGILSTGTGVIGAGNNQGPAILPTGSGGAFVGNDGLYSKGSLANGTGIISLGSNASVYTVDAVNGSGGSFTGYHGSISFANNVSAGTGVIGAGNNVAYVTLATGGGGAFVGSNNGAYAKASGSAGTGIIGVGNNIAAGTTFASGSGGAFTGTVCGVAGYATQAAGTPYGVYGSYTGGGNFDGVGVYGYSWPSNNYGIGVYGMGRKYGVYFSGGLAGTGTKSFVIDHPLDPENKILKHFAIESPEVLNMYRGNVVLNTNGEATIQLPDYFTSININFSYDLTPVGKPAPDLFIKNEINSDGIFTISGGNPNQKISWVVYAERNDLYMQQEGTRDVVINKDEREKGKYLMPNLYNQPPEKGIYYVEPNKEILMGSDKDRSVKSDLTILEIEKKSVLPSLELDTIGVRQLQELPEGEFKKIEDEKVPDKVQKK
jgi:hypothetical protein